MVSSQEILEKTGLKSPRTLTRWHQRGVIPKPVIRTHPSGRGKMAFWPDWVLERCIRINELRKRGHTVDEAVMLIDIEQEEQERQNLGEKPNISEVLESKVLKIRKEKAISLLDIFIAIIVGDLKHLISDRSVRNTIAVKFKEEKYLDLAIDYLDAGYNPVLLFDGNKLEIVPDFLVSHYLSYKPTEGKSYVVLPLLSSLRKAYSKIGKELKVGSLAYPVPRIRIKQGEDLVEYDIAITGVLGFELIRKIGGKADVQDRASKETK